MPSVADIMSLPVVRAATGCETKRMFLNFLNEFDPRVADAERNSSGVSPLETLAPRLGCDVLLEASDDDGDIHSLVRLSFQAAPFALLRSRQPASGNDDDDDVEEDTCHAGITDLRHARALAEAVVAASRRTTCAAFSQPGDDAGALLDFGPTAVVDMAKGVLRFMSSERIGMLAWNGTALAVATMVEDGSFCMHDFTQNTTRSFADFESLIVAVRLFVLKFTLKPPFGTRILVGFGERDSQKALNSVGINHDGEGWMNCSVMEGNREILCVNGEGTTGAFLSEFENIMEKAVVSVRKRMDKRIAQAPGFGS